MGDVASEMEQSPWHRTPLDKDRAEIRILRLQQGSGDAPITCGLQVVSLNDEPSYEALSYAWGDVDKTVPITLDGVRFDATQNLEDFLRCLRYPNQERIIWVDAICIDQTNILERNHQLGLMSRIYRQCKQVDVWFGRFTASWQDEMEFDNFVPSSRFDRETWRVMEQRCLRDLPDFRSMGGIPPSRYMTLQLDQQPPQVIMDRVLDVLDQFAADKHLYEFPLFCVDDRKFGYGLTIMNRSWPVIMECIGWLITRPWWSRVWTLQEAVLPQSDVQVYIGERAVALSRITVGVMTVTKHSTKCCRILFDVAMTSYQHFPFDLWNRSSMLQNCRERHPKREVSFYDIINTAKSREATDVRDHVFGILGLLPVEWAQHFQRDGYNLTAGEIFGQFTKLLYTNNSDTLNVIASAIGVKHTDIPLLPSWAYDFSTLSRSDDEVAWKGRTSDENHWSCYNACGDSKYVGVVLLSDLPGPTLSVDGIYLGTVGVCGRGVTYDEWSFGYDRHSILRMVNDNHDIFKKHAKSYSSNSFWRTMFMDRDIWRFWRHPRNPLPLRRLIDIRSWWENFNRTEDNRDLTFDKATAAKQRGTYHWRALIRTLEEGRFFCTAKGEPGIGPREAQDSDLVYILAGCPALAILRLIVKNQKPCLVFVGCCFVDGYMYGNAVSDDDVWEVLELH